MSRPKILVVDEDETVRLGLKSELETRGSDVRTAGSAAEGLRLASGDAPDVVLLDLASSGGDGIPALAELRDLAPDARVVVLVTANTAEAAVSAQQAGAFDYLLKPLDDPDEVWQIVRRAVENDVAEQPMGSDPPAGGPSGDRAGPPEILVLDDEDSIRHVLTSLLEMKGCVVRQAASAEQGADVLADWEPAVALVDIVLPGRSGISFLGDVKRAYPDTEVLIMTSKASADTAVKAIRLGAYDYVKKPFVLDEVWDVVSRALERRRLNLRNRALLEKQEVKRRELSESVSLVEELPTEVDSEILDEFLTLVCKELHVTRASLLLRKPRGGGPIVAASHGFTPETGRVAEGRGIASRVLETGESFCGAIDGIDGIDETGDAPDRLGDESIAMAVAVKTEHEVLGVIAVGPRGDAVPFDTEDLSYLVRMGAQLAATIDGARRAGQLQRAYESLKSAQQQLVFSERIKAVGQMAAGIAHDFNNVLSVILARAQFIERTLRRDFDPAKTLDHVEAIIKTALQGAEAIRRVQDYTRIRRDVVRAPVNINETIRDAVEIARPKWKAQAKKDGTAVDVRMDLQAVPRVSGNRYELAQVFGNLIFNAVEAMPQGGNLSFRSYVEGDRVVVEVRDTGTGIDEEGLEHLFEPFYTTKENGQGLGTSILYGIVTRHGGEIDVDSEVGVGTCFRVSLPAVDPTDRAEDIESAVEQALGNEVAARVLLVDDDDMVLETYREALSFTGHEVVACGSGEEALGSLADRSFDVVVTDMSMQGMTGLELTRRIKSDHPEICVVLSSGWAVSEESSEVVEAGVDHVLVKPVMLDDLLGTVQRAARRSVKV